VDSAQEPVHCRSHWRSKTTSTQPLENLRPQVIYDALLLQPAHLPKELALLEEGEHMAIDRATQKPVLQPDYTLDIIKQNGQGWTYRAGLCLTKLTCSHSAVGQDQVKRVSEKTECVLAAGTLLCFLRQDIRLFTDWK
jgi:hypothetical protein